jgi:hypothetical protein
MVCPATTITGDEGFLTSVPATIVFEQEPGRSALWCQYLISLANKVRTSPSTKPQAVLARQSWEADRVGIWGLKKADLLWELAHNNNVDSINAD